MRFAAVGACALALAGCGVVRDAVSEPPVMAGKSNVDYQVLAACVTRKLDRPDLKKIDLIPEKTIKISVGNETRVWQVTFIGNPDRSTDWSIVNDLPGGLNSTADRIRPVIASCESEATKR